jgi:hypothetical protein
MLTFSSSIERNRSIWVQDIKDEYDNMNEEEKRKNTRSVEDLLKELGDDEEE